MSDPRFPIGKFQPPARYDAEGRAARIRIIAETPATFARAVHGWTDAQLDTPYREGGWTVRQLVHHMADSHMNAYVRFKLALTEDAPTIKAYDEARWAELADSRTVPPSVSLTLLDTLHQRWVALLEAMDERDFQRTLTHPQRGLLTLDFTLALYAWHGPHHTAHVTRLAERMAW